MTLTETAFYTRLAIKFGTLFLILLIVGRVVVGIGINFYKQVFPPPPPPPKVAFGQLPTLYFPEKAVSSPASYTLQTPTGELPKLPTTTLVYFMPPKSATFSGLDEATKMARNLGFNSNVTELSETIYRFEKPSIPSSLDINVVNKTFSINYNLGKTPELIGYHPQSNDEVLSAVKSLLQSANLLPPELENGGRSFEYLKVDADHFAETLSLSEANFVRVNLFRKDINEMPVLTPSRKRSTVWFLASGDRSRDRQIVAGEYHYFPIDQNQSSTYPIKTADQAWEELSRGKAYIAESSETKQANATIRRVYLAYYDSGTPQGFLQPIVVFEGDSGFSAYVPAIAPNYYGSQPTPSPEATHSAIPNPGP